MKLSTIWAKADKELTRVEGNFGDPVKKTACAMGAISYYQTKGKSVFPSHGGPHALKDYNEYYALLRAFMDATGIDAIELNDQYHTTFSELAAIARIFGL